MLYDAKLAQTMANELFKERNLCGWVLFYSGFEGQSKN